MKSLKVALAIITLLLAGIVCIGGMTILVDLLSMPETRWYVWVGAFAGNLVLGYLTAIIVYLTIEYIIKTLK